MLNSNKRAITLNLKHERGRALLFRMVERRRIAGEFRAWGPVSASAGRYYTG
jgi:crotonobetainyl-CoA:carnitine CoA-transferase CaiB-like acyl-CoA transferase